MDVPAAPAAPVRYNRWLPYWAVLQTDVRQTLRSWVYRLWVLTTVLATAGYLLYKFGVYREAGLVQHASAMVSDLIRWTLFGSLSLVVVLAVSGITAERGTLADSILSRGISRHQYFLAKWHARTFVVVVTFLGLGGVALILSHFLLHEDLHPAGSLLGLVAVAALLAVVTAAGVTVGALTGSSVVGIAVLGGIIYGGGFVLSLLPASIPSPDRLLARMPLILRGGYDLTSLGQLAGLAAAAATVVAAVGLVAFSRGDV
jgi:hypothetical protein